MTIFRTRNTSIGDLVLDCVVAEGHTVSVEVTDSPTEGGKLDGGTKRTLPRTLAITGVVTAKDMGLFAAAPFTSGSRHLDAWSVLEQLWTSTDTFDVVTDVRTYKNCTGYGDLTWDREPNLEAALVFSGTIREVQSGSAKTEKLVDADAELDLDSGTDLGRQGTEELDTAGIDNVNIGEFLL